MWTSSNANPDSSLTIEKLKEAIDVVERLKFKPLFELAREKGFDLESGDMCILNTELAATLGVTSELCRRLYPNIQILGVTESYFIKKPPPIELPLNLPERLL